MTVKSNAEYLYQTPEDCFPEADMLVAGAQKLANDRRSLFKYLINEKGKITSQDYQTAEWRIFFELLRDVSPETLHMYVLSGQTTPGVADLRPLLK